MMMIGGDFNARTGIQKRRLGVEKEEERERRSKDKKTNKESWKLLEAIEKVGMKILNESVAGDEEGEFTYIGGMGETVIDYVIRGEEVRERIKRLEVRDQVDSDYQPIIVHVKKKRRKGMK